MPMSFYDRIEYSLSLTGGSNQPFPVRVLAEIAAVTSDEQLAEADRILQRELRGMNLFRLIQVAERVQAPPEAVRRVEMEEQILTEQRRVELLTVQRRAEQLRAEREEQILAEQRRGNIHSCETDVLEVIDTKLEPNKLYFGVELEHKGPYSDNIYANKTIEPVAILKRDSSVNVELVTIPMEWEQWLDKINCLRQWIAASEGDPHTGMHVHVSHSSFASEEAAYRFIVLWRNMAIDSRWWGGYLAANPTAIANQWISVPFS